MAAVKEAKAAPPTKGVTPNMQGVPGVLMDEAPPDIVFGGRKKVSPYDALLLQLKAAGVGKYMKFDDLKARTSLTARSKKLGIKLLFGEDNNNSLWITLAKAELTEDGVTEKQPTPPTNSDLVLKAIGEKRCTPGEILTWMRSNGANGLGITQVDGLLSNLSRAGKIRNVSGTREEAPRYALL